MSTSTTSAFGAAIFLGVGVTLSALYNYGTGDNVDITVIDKERIVTGSGEDVSSKYLVFTEEGEVFENTDSFLRFKFASSTLQGQLREGENYNCDVYGWRLPFFSMYRNLIACTANDDGQVQLYTTSPQQHGLG